MFTIKTMQMCDHWSHQDYSFYYCPPTSADHFQHWEEGSKEPQEDPPIKPPTLRYLPNERFHYRRSSSPLSLGKPENPRRSREPQKIPNQVDNTVNIFKASLFLKTLENFFGIPLSNSLLFSKYCYCYSMIIVSLSQNTWESKNSKGRPPGPNRLFF